MKSAAIKRRQSEGVGVNWVAPGMVGYVEIPKSSLNAQIRVIHHYCPGARITVAEAHSDPATEFANRVNNIVFRS